MQIDRRKFLQFSTSVATCLAISPSITLAKDSLKYEAIYDKNIKDSFEFAQNFAKQHEIDGDISKFYFENIRHLDDSTAFCGITSYETFFVLQRLFFDKDFVAFYRAEHDFRNDKSSHNVLSQINQEKVLNHALNSDKFVRALALSIGDFTPSSNIKSYKFNSNANSNEPFLVSFAFASRRVL
ncbi:hypothetical protein KDD93_06540 [Campylobacter sp. faydin G-24]|uniref:Uncharacterized protein n=1 Tax=Campylobacter anatolicus TaxID=2829105 RepID=A0ABS5HKL9_9BACT|nr:hypothetical protein [Campylobacter anatolicus]MBR8461420.1 hypothetical protein [Campylobacter anatolicus]MBR8464217.1 hypothetical protein [Campylobacter anatolicus]MBR8466122.1 hypothetical protein [Campylobacter anatolicus]